MKFPLSGLERVPRWETNEGYKVKFSLLGLERVYTKIEHKNMHDYNLAIQKLL